MEKDELIAENKRLRKEIARLKLLLKQHNIPFEENCKKKLSIEEKINIFLDYFKCRNDIYSERYYKNDKKAYAKVCDNKFNQFLCDLNKYKHCIDCPNENRLPLSQSIIRHFRGEKAYAVYPIINNECYFLVIDFDDKEFKECALAYKKECDNLHINSIIEISQSGTGAHVWIFFEKAISCKKARRLGDYILASAMQNNKNISFKSYDRFFPSQDIVDKDGLGNCIALPLQGSCVRNNTSVFVDENFNVYDNQIKALSTIKKMSEIDVDIILENTKQVFEIEATSKHIKKYNLMYSDFPLVLKLIYRDDIYIDKENLSSKSLYAIKSLAILHNPEFYEKQAKRISTYNVNRIIELFKESSNYITIPRGCFDDLIELLEYYHIAYVIDDRRISCNKISIKYNAVLRDNQKEAVDKLLKYDNGLLIAETGSGKTIMSMEIINRLKKPTLILVDKVKLLEQWQDRIKQFMNIHNNSDEISAGIYYGAKKKLTGIIDVASIKSIKDEDQLYDKYEIVIGDEIHHIASKTYEDVIRKFQAKHIYGLTATPNRSDKLEKIIYKSISPIRSMLENNSTGFMKVLKPRFTKFKIKEELLQKNYQEVLNELYNNELRNKQIIEDVIDEYNKAKSILILTDRIKHIDLLKSMLISKCSNIYTISGSNKTKDRKEFNELIKSLDKQYIIISTSSFLGEGFDLGSLNTLFITMPFKFSGKLSQQTGRIHRNYEGKNEVIVYDYVDIKIGMLAHQFQIRLKQYKKENYTTIDENEKINLLYDSSNYYDRLYDDVLNAKEVVLLFNYIKEERFKKFTEVNNNILVITDLEIDNKYNTINMHSQINAIIIDKRILWYGSINPFAYPRKDETILRLVDEEYVKEILKDYENVSVD